MVIILHFSIGNNRKCLCLVGINNQDRWSGCKIVNADSEYKIADAGK